jgi:hypothetical protein
VIKRRMKRMGCEERKVKDKWRRRGWRGWDVKRERWKISDEEEDGEDEM